MEWSPPSPALLWWVAAELQVPAARWSRRLMGGTHALTDVLRTVHGEVVARRFDPGDDAVVREQKVLDILSGLSGLAPQLLAGDPDGSLTGSPSIVTTLVPGVPTLFPADPLEAAGQLGRALARVHAHPCPETLPDLLTAPRPTPGAADALRSGWPQAQTAPRVLTHRDFWTGNTLWVDEQLSGIVDWSGAGRGPRGQDLSWCRLDLVLLHGRAVADALVTAYEHWAGVRVHDLPWWDRYAATNAADGVEDWAPNYQDLGRHDLDGPTLRARLDAWFTELTDTWP